MLITAGPTQEPIDRVRFIGNRSSGRLGIALADHAAQSGWQVTLLLGPTTRTPTDSRVRLLRFLSTADLQAQLSENFPNSDVLIMAAAVADYRPAPNPDVLDSDGKLRRSAQGLTLKLEPTPDLLAECSASRRPDQLLVGFALEPRQRLIESARAKLVRKGIDLVVANPLETMDAPMIEATILSRDGSSIATPGTMSKEQFAPWLLERVSASLAGRTV